MCWHWMWTQILIPEPGLSTPFTCPFLVVDPLFTLSLAINFFPLPRAGSLPFQISIQPHKSLYVRQKYCPSKTGTALTALLQGLPMFFDLHCLCPPDQGSSLHLNELDHIFGEETGKTEEWVPYCAGWQRTEGIEGKGRESSCQMQLQRVTLGQTAQRGQVHVDGANSAVCLLCSDEREGSVSIHPGS